MNKLFYKNLLPGTKLFGRFPLIRCLCSSDIGGVYLCSVADEPGKLVALKVVSNIGNESDPAIKEQIFREVILSKSLTHKNVLKSYEYFEDSEFIAFSMEFIHGGSLADKIKTRSIPHYPEILNWLKQMAEGLNAIHSAGIVHRDLKPENILVTEDGTLKIADFGISIQQGEDPSTSSDRLTGTVNYLSPEYIAKGVCDHLGDIYAWGVMAYLLITGKLPFQGDNLIDSLTRRVMHDPYPPHSLRPETPRELSEIILQALERNPAKRIQSAAELLDSLNEVRMTPVKREVTHRANDDSVVIRRVSDKAVA